MATVTFLNNTQVTTNLATYSTGAFTPAANTLIVIGVGTSGAATAGVQPTTESVTSNVPGLNFVQVGGLSYMSDNTRRVNTWISTVFSTGVSTTLTYTASGAGFTNFTTNYMTVYSVAGMTFKGTSAFRQWTSVLGLAQPGVTAPTNGVINTNNAGTIIFPAAPLTTNPILIWLDNNNGGTGPAPTDAGFTSAHTYATVNTPASGGMSYYRNGGFTSATINMANYNAQRINNAIELDSSTGAPATPHRRVVIS